MFTCKRGIEAIRGDGNCSFRALSRILCGSEDNHNFVRRTLVTFSANNKGLLQKFCHPKPIEQHLNGMKLVFCWAQTLKYMQLLLFGKCQSMCVPRTPMIQHTFGYVSSQPTAPSWSVQMSVNNCEFHQAFSILNCIMIGGVIMTLLLEKMVISFSTLLLCQTYRIFT